MTFGPSDDGIPAAISTVTPTSFCSGALGRNAIHRPPHSAFVACSARSFSSLSFAIAAPSRSSIATGAPSAVTRTDENAASGSIF